MAKLGISTGIIPNDGLGDSLLVGAVKINSNFSEIYTYFGNGNNLTFIGAGGTSQWVTTDVGIHTLSNVGIGTTNPTSKLSVSGDGTFTGVVTATSFVGNLTGIATYTSEWILGAVGSSDYTFTGPGFTGTESDPALYLVRGQQYKFTNTMNAHPFRIQSTVNGSTGTQYDDGIVNNNVSNGTLTWNVQFDAPNILYYQCTAHTSMGGIIYITPRNEPAVGIRTTVTAITGSIGVGVTSNLNINGFKTYSLLKVGITSAAWVVLYTDSTSRSNDSSRSYLTDPTPGSGVIAEVRTTSPGTSTFIMSPGVIGWNNEVSVASTIYARVTNNENSTSTGIGVTLTLVKLED